MNRKQFAVIAVFTAMETYFFNEATMAGQMLFACFWALLILRNLQTAYMVEKIASAIEKEINKLIEEVHPHYMSVPGIGPLSAAVIYSEYGDISNFTN